MRVLFLLLYHPEPHESSNLYADLVGEFVKNGHEVTVVSAAKEGQPTALQREENVNVLRVKTQKIFNVHPLLKGIATVRMPYQFKRAIKKHLSEYIFDLIITPTPPITFVDIVAWLKRKHTLQSYLILRDIFPQNARDLGMIIANHVVINLISPRKMTASKLFFLNAVIRSFCQRNCFPIQIFLSGMNLYFSFFSPSNCIRLISSD